MGYYNDPVVHYPVRQCTESPLIPKSIRTTQYTDYVILPDIVVPRVVCRGAGELSGRFGARGLTPYMMCYAAALISFGGMRPPQYPCGSILDYIVMCLLFNVYMDTSLVFCQVVLHV